MSNVLFLVHVEEAFRKFFPDLYLQRVRKSALSKKYDRVVFLISGIEDFDPVPELRNIAEEIWDWGWGYEPESFDYDKEELEWVISANGHEWTWVPPEIRDMKNIHAFVGGGYETECLQDWLDVLDHCDIPYTKIDGLIYP